MIRISLVSLFFFFASLLHAPIAFAVEKSEKPAETRAANEAKTSPLTGEVAQSDSTPYFMREKRRLAEVAIAVPSDCRSCSASNMCGNGNHCMNGCCQPVQNKCVSNDQCQNGACDKGRCADAIN